MVKFLGVLVAALVAWSLVAENALAEERWQQVKIYSVPVLVTALPTQSPPTWPGHLTQTAYDDRIALNLFHIVRFDSTQKVVEQGQWVEKKRTPQYRIGYGSLPEGGGASINLPKVLYSRAAEKGPACRSGWIKRTFYPGESGNRENACLASLHEAPLLASALELLGHHGEKVVQLREYISTAKLDAASPRFDFWFHPVFWEDLTFHKSVLELLRAPATRSGLGYERTSSSPKSRSAIPPGTDIPRPTLDFCL